MSLKITFVNPNTEQDVDKYLPRILAAAVINKVVRDASGVNQSEDSDCNVKNSA